MLGTIIQINEKQKTKNERGLPKIPVDYAMVIFAGLTNDYNNYRQESLAGALDQAILIMTADIFKQLLQENWNITAGDLGENFTIQDIKYTDLEKGQKFSLGKEVIIELTKKARPCRNLASIPSIGEEKVSAFIKTMIDRRGWYAKVLKEGKVEKNDKFVLIKN